MFKFVVVVAAVAGMALPGAAWAQDLDFSGINQGTSQPQVAALTPPPGAPVALPPAGATGQGAPYYGYNQYEYGRWNTGYYNRYNELKSRYDNVRSQVKSVRRYYRSGSYERRAIDASLDNGETIWRQYKRYQDQNSAYALEIWIQQWQQTLPQYSYYQNNWNTGGYYNNGGYYDNGGYYSGGYYTGGYSNGGYYNNGGYYGTGGGYYDYNRYQLPEYGYYDTYNRGYYGGNVYYGNTAYTDGLLLGNSIGHIVNGSRYDNNLELAGGVLGTVGNTLNIFNNTRGW